MNIVIFPGDYIYKKYDMFFVNSPKISKLKKEIYHISSSQEDDFREWAAPEIWYIFCKFPKNLKIKEINVSYIIDISSSQEDHFREWTAPEICHTPRRQSKIWVPRPPATQCTPAAASSHRRLSRRIGKRKSPSKKNLAKMS